MKRMFAVFLCILFFLSGCKKRTELIDLNGEIAIELYTNKTNSEENNCYYLSGGNTVETDGYMPCYHGGTPYWVRDLAGGHFKKTGHEMYQEHGQLDDYYIDESDEIYLYNYQNIPEILWFHDGIRQNIQATIDSCRQIQVTNKKLYLIGLNIELKDGCAFRMVEKIALETGKQETLEYRIPYQEGISKVGESTTRINSDESFFSHMDVFGGRDNIRLSFADGRYKVIETSKEKMVICLVIEFADGYGILEAPHREAIENKEDFYLILRYFDYEGNETGQKNLDCTKMISASDNTLRMGLDCSAMYYDGNVYLALANGAVVNCFRYDLKNGETEFVGFVKEPLICESRLVLVKENNIYSLTDKRTFCQPAYDE